MSSGPDAARGDASVRGTSADRGAVDHSTASLRPAIVALVVLAAVAVAHFPDVQWLAGRWLTLGNESHGLLIALLVPYFIWQRRSELSPSARGRTAACLALVGLELAYAYAEAASVDAARLALLPAIAICGIGTALGARAARVLAPSLASFAFAVPLWDVLTPPLQQLTVFASTLMLSLVGVPAHIDGNMISIPAGTFEVVGGCSGTNYLVVAFATAAILALVNRLDARRTLRVVMLAAATALVANWVRVTSIVCIGHATEMTSPLVEQHIGFGWVVFAVAMVPLFWHATHLPSRLVRPAAGTQVRGSPAWLAAAMLAPFASTALLAAYDLRHAGALEVRWSAPAERLRAAGGSDWQPEFPGASVSDRIVVAIGDEPVDVYVAAYTRQERGSELVGSLSTLGGRDWREAWTRIVSTPVPHASSVRETLLERGAEQRLVWSWYEVRGARDLAPWRVKLREGLAVFGAERRSAIVALSAGCRPDCVAAREALGRAAGEGVAAVRIVGGVDSGR